MPTELTPIAENGSPPAGLAGAELAAGVDRASAFAATVNAAAVRLFGDAELSLQLREIAARMVRDCQRLHRRGGTDTPSIAVLGSVGEGKSWLARCFLLDSPGNQPSRAEIRSGQHEDTDRLTWFGPTRPTGLAEQGERFLHLDASQMLDLGRPYVVGDTPGFSHQDNSHRALASVAATSAPIKLVVTSLAELRNGRTQEFVHDMNGALILPVIRFDPSPAEQTEPDDQHQRDVRNTLDKWRRAAPAAEILEPCYMPTQRIYGSQRAERLMQQRLQDALAPPLAEAGRLRLPIERQVHERIREARQEIARALQPFRHRVGNTLARLQAASGRLSQRTLAELLGEDIVLRAGTRQRFRADWIDRTPSLCFPYRTFLGLLSLTAGAWDRLIFSMVGSAPSLAMTFFQSVRNLRDASEFVKKLRGGLAERVERLVQDEINPEVRAFQAALASVLPADEEPGSAAGPTGESWVRVVGLDELEIESRGIFRDSIEQNRAGTLSLALFGLLGPGVFLYLIAGPIVSVYRSYLQAHWETFRDLLVTRGEFPIPSSSMLLGSLLLSMAPAFLVALLAISWSCRGGRVRRAVRAIHSGHNAALDARISDGRLRIELTDPRLDAARLLLSLAEERSLRGEAVSQQP
ncbi:MAG: hypothetical protein AB7O62_16800 [Pirellulales bacterium]